VNIHLPLLRICTGSTPSPALQVTFLPFGCIRDINNNYMLNTNDKSTRQCGDNGAKCICKTNTCLKCPPNTYSEGGKNPTCTPCPEDRPYTFLNSKQDSEKSCTNVKDAIECEAGYTVAKRDIFTSGPASQCSGISKITTVDECKAAAKYNSQNHIDDNLGFAGTNEN
jgi:hypothetical protein